MNFINEHVSSNFYSRQLFFNTPANSQNQLARIKVAGHVFINEIHSVVFPRFRVILRTDCPMALCQHIIVPDPLKKRERVGDYWSSRPSASTCQIIRSSEYALESFSQAGKTDSNHNDRNV